MDHNLIQLLIWMIARETTKDQQSKDDEQKVFRKMCQSLSEYNIRINEDCLTDSHIKLGKNMINFYYNHFTVMSNNDSSDGTIKLIEFPLINGKYDIEFRELELIGGGTFGKVFKTENVLDHEKYAIKQVQLNEENREKILREVRIGSKLSQSPYMVQYKASWTENINDAYKQITDGTEYKSSESKSVIDGDQCPLTGNILYIHMELCGIVSNRNVKCHTLKDAIIIINDELNQSIGKPITHIGAFIASQFLEEILNGIKYLHKFGIIHRDLKPENIFITEGRGGNFIKIGDFGLCAENSNGNDSKENTDTKAHIKLSQRCGTEGYIPPGVSVSGIYDETWDIYSWAVIAMDLFCIDKDKYRDILLNKDDELWRIRLKMIRGGNKHNGIVLSLKIYEFFKFVCDMRRYRSMPNKPRHYFYDFIITWLITLNNIETEPDFTHIVRDHLSVDIFENVWDKIDRIPLSDYIVISKLNDQRKREKLEVSHGYEYVMRTAVYRFSAIYNENFFKRNQSNTQSCISGKWGNPQSHYLTYHSDFGLMTNTIFGIIFTAFNVHASKRSAYDMINKWLNAIDNTVVWAYEVKLLRDAKHVIRSRKGYKSFHAYYVYDGRCLCISVNNYIDANKDPQLALALKLSAEEQRHSQNRQSQSVEEQCTNQHLESDQTDDDTAKESSQIRELSNMTDEEQIAYAIQMSMEHSDN